MNVQVLHQNFGDNFPERQIESYFIKKFGTVFPGGINIDGGIVT